MLFFTSDQKKERYVLPKILIAPKPCLCPILLQQEGEVGHYIVVNSSPCSGELLRTLSGHSYQVGSLSHIYPRRHRAHMAICRWTKIACLLKKKKKAVAYVGFIILKMDPTSHANTSTAVNPSSRRSEPP